MGELLPVAPCRVLQERKTYMRVSHTICTDGEKHQFPVGDISAYTL